MAKWIRPLTTDQVIPGSSPGRVDTYFLKFAYASAEQNVKQIQVIV